VFIQGGGYTGNANANYNGSTVVGTSGNNIVFVNFNYRVASWGFLASSKVRKGGDLNAGLLDQRALLHWVQKYISIVSNAFSSHQQMDNQVLIDVAVRRRPRSCSHSRSLRWGRVGGPALERIVNSAITHTSRESNANYDQWWP
jgi:hypothetical protein